MNFLDFTSEVIRSKDNPGIKLYRKLMNSKKERQSYGLFVLEGSRLVFDALKENAPVRKIFITESAATGEIGKRLSELAGEDMDITVVSDEIGNRISDTDSPQGIFAQCSFIHNKGRLLELKAGGKYIVLYQLQDPGNAGMIIRTADAVGMDGVILCQSCDIYNPKTIRSTMGSVFRVPFYITGSTDEIFSAASKAGIETFAAVVDSGAENLKTTSFKSGGAVFIGNEGNGLPDSVSVQCDRQITIKMNGNIDSLNAAMAAGIMMWEMTGND